MEHVSIHLALLLALFGGVLSFVSPCVLPLVPAYLSYISGISVDDLTRSRKNKAVLMKVSLNSIAFILGFSVVFILLFGATASGIGKFLSYSKPFIMQVAGLIIFIFGLHMIGLFRIQFLYYEKKFHTQSKSLGLLGSFVIGFAFAFGWSPCIGPILTLIMAMAIDQESSGQIISLFAIYSLGLGIPFFLTGVSINKFMSMFDRIKRHFRIVEIVSGGLLIAIGFLYFIDYFEIVNGWFLSIFSTLGLENISDDIQKFLITIFRKG